MQAPKEHGGNSQAKGPYSDRTLENYNLATTTPIVEQTKQTETNRTVSVCFFMKKSRS